MRIRTISGATLTEAMGRVRDELGPDAVILHVEDAKSKKGVIIRAAADGPQDAIVAQPSPIAGERAALETRLERELHLKLRMFQPRPRTSSRIDPATSIAPACAFHRIPARLAANLVALAAEADAGDDACALAHALERMMSCAPLPAAPARPIIVLGAPGHGKTTALARLGVQAVTAGAPVTIVTLDTGKAGAVSQIETYANLLKARSEIVETPEDLKDLIAAQKPGAVVLIDTPGINPWSASDLDDARAWIAASGAEPVWVTTAELDCEDIELCARTYAGLGVRRCIVTKLDQVRRLGAILALANRGPLALAHTVASPFLADGMQTPSHLTLAQALLQSFHAAQNQTTCSFKEAVSA